MTQDRAVPGTVPYLSPEQAQGHEVGPPSDVYSLGLVLLECLTGRREFPGGALESAVARLLRDPVIPADLPDPWSDVLVAMTDREPDRRPSAAGVAAALSVPFTDRPPSDPVRTVPVTVAAGSEAPADTGRRRARRRPVWIVAGVLAAAVATGALVAANSADPGGADRSDPARSPTSVVTTDPVVPTVTVTAAPPPVAGPGPSVTSGDPSIGQPADPVPGGQPAAGPATGAESAAGPTAGSMAQPPPENSPPDVPAPDAGSGNGPVDGGGNGNAGGNGTGNGNGNGNGNANGNGNGNANGNGNGNGNGR